MNPILPSALDIVLALAWMTGGLLVSAVVLAVIWYLVAPRSFMRLASRASRGRRR